MGLLRLGDAVGHHVVAEIVEKLLPDSERAPCELHFGLARRRDLID